MCACVSCALTNELGKTVHKNNFCQACGGLLCRSSTCGEEKPFEKPDIGHMPVFAKAYANGQACFIYV